jgi:hypothetical protein
MIQTLKLGATVSCKMLVNSYKITLCDVPYDHNYEVPLCQLAFSFVSRCTLVRNKHFSLCCNNPTRTQAASLLRFLDHTQLHTHAVRFLWTNDHLVTEVATCKTHNKDKRQATIPSAVFEPAIPASERPQTLALDIRPPESAWN